MKKRGSDNNGKRFYKKNKKAQVWVETVLYTLIAFVMIGLVLAYARPKIEELQDQAIIEQSISVIKNIDSIILTIGSPGNQRLIELGLKKGSIKIDGENDKIFFELESKNTYSEPGIDVIDGNLIIRTEKTGDYNLITITRDYSGEYDIKYQNRDEVGLLTKTSTSYNLLISNKGGETTKINFELS